ncbi:MAG: hypothetical protein FWC89_11365 [Defluviitaleaceae bacterium]|nr:hypothetical protein [Defluviitaleaceae bacterium]
MKKISKALGLIIMSALVFCGCVGVPKNSTINLPELLENIDEISLTIYHIPLILTPFPWTMEMFMDASITDSITIDSDGLKEHMDFLTEIVNRLDGGVLRPFEGDTRESVVMHYVFKATDDRELLSVTIWGFHRDDDGTVTSVMFVNGNAVYEDHLLIELVVPFLPEGSYFYNVGKQG